MSIEIIKGFKAFVRRSAEQFIMNPFQFDHCIFGFRQYHGY